MNIIIAGGGKVGQTLARQLAAEGHSLTMIDQNNLVLERTVERYDAIGVAGNCASMEVLQQAGLCLSGTSPDGRLVETVELSDRPFHVGVQYHPEFKSRPNKPHPLFLGFVRAALEEQK